jgi:hypothetical protein
MKIKSRPSGPRAPFLFLALLAAAPGCGGGNGGNGDADADAAETAPDATDVHDVEVADTAEILPAADPRPRMFVPRIVPDDGSGEIWNYKQRSVIFWFGRVDVRNDHVQCRAGYGDALLMMHCAVFDREIYDEAADTSVRDWDALALYIDLDGDPEKTAIDDRSLLIEAQAHRQGTDQSAIYRGQAGAWVDSGLAVGTSPTETPDLISLEKAYRGEERDQSRGWHINFYIPWSVLGYDGPPLAAGESLWNVALTAYDRDSLDGSLRGDPQAWPGGGFDELDPSQWGTWEFLDGRFLGWEESGAAPGAGRPAYAIAYTPEPYASASETTVTIRAGLDSDVIENASVGASEMLCSGDDDYNFGTGENSWGGNLDRAFFHIQDQEDYADWPCFAKIYLKFPLAKLPDGKVVVSATLRMHHSMPTSGGDQGYRSLVQAFHVGNFLRDGVTPWTAANITWNEAPLAVENLSGFWGDRTGMSETGWDNLPEWTWDVSRAVARAAGDDAVSFALYSADSEYHTGKMFVQSSDFPDWGDPGQRPTLEITFADPLP